MPAPLAGILARDRHLVERRNPVNIVPSRPCCFEIAPRRILMRWTLCVLAGLALAVGLHASPGPDPGRARGAGPGASAGRRLPRASIPSPATRAWWCSRTWATSRTTRCRSCVCSCTRTRSNLEGLVATTSTWQRKATHPETMKRDHRRVRRGAPEPAEARPGLAGGEPPGRAGRAGAARLRHGRRRRRTR